MRATLSIVLAALLTSTAFADMKINGVILPSADTGMPTIGRAVTDTLFVSPSGSGTDGSSWAKAYTDLQSALDAATTNANECTLILLSPHTTNYNINTTGDPTWAGNYILKGSHRNWVKIRNSHASATSVLKFTGRVSLNSLTIDCGAGSNNGVIISGSGSKGARLSCVYFECENVTGAQTALTIADNEYALLKDVMVHGAVTYTTGLLLDDCKLSNFGKVDFHDCLTGMQLVDTSPDNIFSFVFFHECMTALDIDSGDDQFFHELAFGDCTTNVDDEVENHGWTAIHGSFPIAVEPTNGVNYAGVSVSAGEDDWGADTQIRAAAASTKPFRIVGYRFEPSQEKKVLIRFSADSGATFFDMALLESKKNKAQGAATGTEFIFNSGTRISASAGCEDAAVTIQVWLEIQEI